MAASTVRRRAEIIAEKSRLVPQGKVVSSTEDVLVKLYELQVHEIELNLQNEELLRNQLELSTSRARYFELYEQAPVGYCTVNVHGVILEANLTFASMVGADRGMLIERPLHQFVLRADRRIEHEYRTRVFSTGGTHTTELRMKGPAGVEWWAHLEASALRQGGDVCRLAISDVSQLVAATADRERLQAQLHQSRKLEAMGRLAGGVAHDFNNMLEVILGHVDIANDKIGPDHPLAPHLEEIARSAHRSAGIVRQLLGFASRQTVAPSVVKLNAVVAPLIEFLRRLIGENIALRWQPEPDLWPVKIDPSQVEQILVNLCVNARDAIAGAGQVDIRTGVCELTPEFCAGHPGSLPGQYVRLSVSDSGRGMDSGTLEHIFEPFFTTKGVGRGRGFGLASVYGSVRQGGGFIVAESALGGGSTFTIYLPRYEGSDQELLLSQPGGPLRRGSETILLIEDEKPVLEVVAINLERLGYTVLPARNAKEAERLLQCQSSMIHLLLTDVIMPEVNGKEFAEKLLSKNPGIKILFMSGYPADIIARNGVLEPGLHFLQKPFTLSELAEKIGKVLDEKAPPQPARGTEEY